MPSVRAGEDGEWFASVESVEDLHCCFQTWSQVIVTEANSKTTLVQ